MTTARINGHPVTVYQPRSPGLSSVGQYLSNAWRRRPFVWHLARTDLKSENYDTILGQVWIILDPLLMALIYYLVRTVIRPIGSGADRNDLIAHLIVSVFFFQYSATALRRGATSLIRNARLILNSSLPKIVYPAEVIVKGVLDFAPTLVVYFIIHAFLGQEWGLSLVFLPLVIVLMTVFNIGLTLFFGTVSVFFKDTTNFIPYFVRLWLFMSPVLYTINEIPDHLWSVLKWNPMVPYLGLVDEITNGEAISGIYLLGAIAWSTVALVAGAILFWRRERDVAPRL